MVVFSIIIDTLKGFKGYEWWQMVGCLLFASYFTYTGLDRDSVAGVVLCFVFALNIFTSSGWRQQSKQWESLYLEILKK